MVCKKAYFCHLLKNEWQVEQETNVLVFYIKFLISGRPWHPWARQYNFCYCSEKDVGGIPHSVLQGLLQWFVNGTDRNIQEKFDLKVVLRTWDVKICETHCLEKTITPKRMGLFQFYIPDLTNYPSYPNQKEFLKSNQGNLK